MKYIKDQDVYIFNGTEYREQQKKSHDHQTHLYERIEALERQIEKIGAITHTDNSAVIDTLQKDNYTLTILLNQEKERTRNLDQIRSKMYEANQLLYTHVKELEAIHKHLSDDRRKMANDVSRAVWQELMDRAENIDGPVNTMMPGFGFNDISDIILNKILEYDNESEKS